VKEYEKGYPSSDERGEITVEDQLSTFHLSRRIKRNLQGGALIGRNVQNKTLSRKMWGKYSRLKGNFISERQTGTEVLLLFQILCCVK
jgi:hypothetical protein